MNETKPSIAAHSYPSSRGGLFRRSVIDRLKLVEQGEVQFIEDGECMLFGQVSELCPIRVTVHIHDASMYRDIALGGSIAAAEAYMLGKWTTTDLTGLMRIIAANPKFNEQIEGGMSRLLAPVQKLLHFFNSNTKKQSKKNIHAHYDMGDDLFELFLDPTMSYSSAVYPHADASLHEASIHKLDLVCQKLHLTPDDHLLEIGTGWGGLAVHAAGKYGCRVTTTTISDNQYQMAQQRVREAGLEDRVTLLKKDYRDLEGQYDKLVSIEMIEAVGHKFMDTYLSQCSERLAPNGRALFQAILMNDHNYEEYRNSVDFIRKYIFPGGALPSMNSIMNSILAVTDMRISGFQDISLDYARTLRHWRDGFMSKLHEVKHLGYPDEFIRMWEFYLCYCEGGFTERAIHTVQVVFDKPECRLEPGLIDVPVRLPDQLPKQAVA
ncbi:MAG: class I SAM-dependent methyltransferase [Gammaproteobacteria bacterium]